VVKFAGGESVKLERDVGGGGFVRGTSCRGRSVYKPSLVVCGILRLRDAHRTTDTVIVTSQV
jgi:hypothetical protein